MKLLQRIGWLVGLCLGWSTIHAYAAERTPNIVVVFTDDQGYGDLGCYGAHGFKTPHLDRLAQEGIRFTDFYVAQAVCSASRTALLTGCYPNRLGIVGALGPKDRHGIHADETTLGELCRSQKYATCAVGKWHLGHHQPFLPLQHGFDEYLGLPYSNDMWPKHPTAGANFPDLPLISGNAVIEKDPDQTQLTKRYTERAVDFINRHASQPFFLYLAHNMPHVPLFTSEEFKGKSLQGPYGDVIEEIDWSVGQILSALKNNNIDQETLVIFTCDNGPWLSYGSHAGSAGPLREGKGTTFEGGVRVPFLARWPGKIPAGAVCREPAMTIDLFPTIARLIGAPLVDHQVNGRKIDGLDIWPLLSGQPQAQSPHEVLYFYWLNRLDAVRSGRWKLHVPHEYPRVIQPGAAGKPGQMETRRTELALYDLIEDPGERNSLAGPHPDVVARLQSYVESARADLGDSATQRTGTGVRQPGRLPE
ncbi:MAG: sulfatase [Planctomycetes bacterium]|nr:sulfatase [Planctomycetota bacterium]